MLWQLTRDFLKLQATIEICSKIVEMTLETKVTMNVIASEILEAIETIEIET